jgi:hypothetical protein
MTLMTMEPGSFWCGLGCAIGCGILCGAMCFADGPLPVSDVVTGSLVGTSAHCGCMGPENI